MEPDKISNEESGQSANNEKLTVGQVSVEVPQGRVDADIAAKFLQTLDPAVAETPISDIEYKKVLRKIDFIILPLITGTIILAAVDKVIISNVSRMSHDILVLSLTIPGCDLWHERGYPSPTQRILLGRVDLLLWLPRLRVPLCGTYPALSRCEVVVSCLFWLGCDDAMHRCYPEFRGSRSLQIHHGNVSQRPHKPWNGEDTDNIPRTEAMVFPVSSIMTVMWWRTKEQPIRVAFWFNQGSDSPMTIQPCPS